MTRTAISPSNLMRVLSVGLLCVGAGVTDAGVVLATQASKALPVSQTGAAQPGQPAGGSTQSQPPAPDGRRGFGPQGGDGRGGRGGPSSDYKFWKDPAVIKEIGLTPDQATRIDRIYEDRARRIAPFAEELDRTRGEVDRLIRERTADSGAVELQASHSTTLFAKLQETRIVMLYRQYMVLTPDQHKKLQAILERQRATGEHGRGRGNEPRQ